MLVNDWTFAVIAMITIPLSIAISRHMLKRMRNNDKRSMEINAKMTGFNQEAFSNVQTIKAFSLIPEYIKRLHRIQIEYISMRLKYQKSYIGISLINVLLSLLVSYVAYGWGIYRVWSGVITYGSMTLFISLSSSLSSSIDGMIAIVPMIMKISVSSQRLMDIVEMPCEDYSNDADVKEFAKYNIDTGISIMLSEINYSYKN